MGELIPQIMSTWWGLLLICVGMGVIGVAQVRAWDSREELARVVTFAAVLILVGAAFTLWGPR